MIEIKNIDLDEAKLLLDEKIIIVGDSHFGRFPTIEQQALFLTLILIPLLDMDTVVIFTGDQFDGGKAMETILMCDVLDIFLDISAKCKHVYFLVGNHDTWKLKDIHYNNSKIFVPFNNFSLIERGMCEIFGVKIDFISFNVDKQFLLDYVKDSKSDIAITHCDYKNLTLETGRKIDFGIDIESMSNYKIVFNGHIHKRQLFNNLINVGAPYQMKFSDRESEKGLHIYIPKSNETFFVENTISRKYFEYQNEDFLKLEDKGFLNDANLNILDADSEEEIIIVLGDNKPYWLDINLKNGSIVTISEASFVYSEDVAENIVEYLEDVKQIKLSDKTIEIDKTKIEALTKLAKTL